MNRTLDVLSTYTATGLRLGLGLRAGALGPRPAQRLELYEFEGCPFCRKVREALVALDLEAIIYPCPKNGPTYRPHVKARGGKSQFPYLIDPNTGDAMYESAEIIRHLYKHYGAGRAPYVLTSNITLAFGSLASLVRGRRGVVYRPARKPEQPLELYSFEASPYSRIAREVLCELELPYVLHNVGKRSPSRAAFIARSGAMRVPWLFDPNTDRAMFESADIKRYLLETYAV